MLSSSAPAPSIAPSQADKWLDEYKNKRIAEIVHEVDLAAQAASLSKEERREMREEKVRNERLDRRRLAEDITTDMKKETAKIAAMSPDVTDSYIVLLRTKAGEHETIIRAHQREIKIQQVKKNDLDRIAKIAKAHLDELAKPAEAKISAINADNARRLMRAAPNTFVMHGTCEAIVDGVTCGREIARGSRFNTKCAEHFRGAAAKRAAMEAFGFTDEQDSAKSARKE
jgi:hypothetical protein